MPHPLLNINTHKITPYTKTRVHTNNKSRHIHNAMTLTVICISSEFSV